MATTIGSAAVLGVPLAPPAASTQPATAVTPSVAKTMEQLMKEIDDLKPIVEASAKKLEKIDMGRKKIEANRNEATAGRTEIRGLKDRVIDLQKQVDALTKAADSTPRTFEKRQKNAQKALSNLSSRLDHADKHLEKATGPAGADPAATATASPEKENTRGVGSLLNRLPLMRKKSASQQSSLNATPPTPAKVEDDATRKTAKDPVASGDEDDDDDVEEGEDGSDDDDDVVSDKKTEPRKLPPSTKKTEALKVDSDVSDDDDDSEEDDDDGADDQRQLSNALQSVQDADKDLTPDGRRSRTPLRSEPVPAINLDSARTASPKPKKTTTTVPPLPPTRKKTPSPRRRRQVPAPKEEEEEEESEEDSYFEEEQEEEDEELRRLHGTGDHGEADDYVEGEEDEGESVIANTRTQEFRNNKYPPGTQFVVTHPLTGVQADDLTIQRGEILTLIEQLPDDWWRFKNNQTQQQGVVPINHIELLPNRPPRLRAKPSTSATTLVGVFKANTNIPAGCTPSDLAPLTELEEYKLSRVLVPHMTDSNLAFADLHWRVDNDRLHVHDVTYQKILTVKECVKIPRAKGEQIRVLDRCVRVCLYDGFEIVSNIHTFRAHVPNKIDERDLTENWTFLTNNINTLTDEQSQVLLRSNRTNSDQRLNLLIELSQWCQSTVTQEKCEIACGWSIVPLDDDKPPLITDTKDYDELLNGGHTAEANVLLDPQYKILRSNGLSGWIDRRKRARVQFSIESRESDVDLVNDTLPTQPIVVPINLIDPLSFFRSELSYQLHKRQHPTGLSTTPIDSLFLSTFFQTLAQPDLIYTLRRLYHSRKGRVLKSSPSTHKREAFIQVYERFIYPLLHYRQLPPYDFHDITALNERRKLINDMVKRQLPNKKTPPQDILSILLDPTLTDKWTPFTTDEISFTLQKYIHQFTPDMVA